MESVYATIHNGKSFLTMFEYDPDTPITLTLGIDAILSTIIADATLTWNLLFVFVDFVLTNG